MATQRILDDDIVRVRSQDKPKGPPLATLFWGDTVKIVGEKDGKPLVELTREIFNPQTQHFEKHTDVGVIAAKARFRNKPLLKVRFVDVGQGDGAVIETPSGQIILVDGGEELHMTRYIRRAFGHILDKGPLRCAAIVVTHGDADHYSGLTKLVKSSRGGGSPVVTADRVLHNGLVKRSADKDIQAFGKTATSNGGTFAVELRDDITAVPDAQMNTHFQRWKEALQRLKQDNASISIRRVAFGDTTAFDFLAADGIRCEVLGPITETANGKPALPFLHQPGSKKKLSASHTVNGHSIVLKLTHGNVRFLFGADLNEESEERLVQHTTQQGISLAADVLKVPHHGSADFSPHVLEAIRPVVSVISSGDESTAKEYIHPRAGLVGAIGRFSRGTVPKPLIYVTEMVAFFERLGDVAAKGGAGLTVNGKAFADAEIHNAYRKTAFGIVHVRTNGERVLVATHSGKDDQKESYAFRVTAQGEVQFENKTRIV